jgi:hypothetical protein
MLIRHAALDIGVVKDGDEISPVKRQKRARGGANNSFATIL